MWLWIKRWRDWAMHDLWPMHRTGPQPQALHYSYEKAGLTLHDQPIPWNAEAVLVEALVRLPSRSPRRKADFHLRISRQDLIAPESMRRDDGEEHHRLFFRFTPPGHTVAAELLCGNHVLGQLTLPALSREEFISRLQLQMPTLFVRISDQSVACQTFVASQCRGLLASALLTSPTSLVPLLDLGLQIEIRSERGGPVHAVPARLCSSQLAGKQALITIVPRRFPKRIGTWVATWMLGDRPLASQQMRAISQRHFRRSLRVCDTRFVIQWQKRGVHLTRHLPHLDGIARLGPCFLVCSREPGMAGVCTLQVRTQVPGSVAHPPLLVEDEVLITDGPTMFAPGTVDVSDLGQVNAFELRSKGGMLAVVSLSPAPMASFTAEGGFKPPHDFPWSPAAEEELTDRLTRLLDGRGNSV
jgi:hypothetical protein